MFETPSTAGGAGREVALHLPNGMGYRSMGKGYRTGSALPDSSFHVTTADANLHGTAVSLGKPDFLQHLGPPNVQEASSTHAPPRRRTAEGALPSVIDLRSVQDRTRAWRRPIAGP